MHGIFTIFVTNNTLSGTSKSSTTRHTRVGKQPPRTLQTNTAHPPNKIMNMWYADKKGNELASLS